jgi:hypothetical protein
MAARERAASFSWDHYAGRVAAIIAGADSKSAPVAGVGQ